ncbi:hypothetical protein GCM10012275_52610 [Longimycelium tulufanense]|uniref:Uncharacterized protein n=1 Tax=Longimycelium tulufanense TaxID=907463 RepID=A0A8J3FYE8_9PSEU|nr:hypothetical protein [Longimycelium tulufanense]GGM75424.1 hypothetical protein GCM10012275_52610 [Longimycelium tulufanense]
MTMREHRNRRDAERLHAAAAKLRDTTTQDGYAGLSRPEVRYAVAELLDAVARSIDTVGHDVRLAATGIADYALAPSTGVENIWTRRD